MVVEAKLRLALLAHVFLEEKISEWEDLISPLSEGGNCNRDDPNPFVEVRTILLLREQVLEITIGGIQEPDVSPEVRGATEALIDSALQHNEHLALVVE